MRTAAILLSLSVIAAACGGSPSATAGLSGEPLSQAEDAFIESTAHEFVEFDRARGVDFLNTLEYRCVFRRLVDDLGYKEASRGLNLSIEPADLPTATTEWGLVFLDAYYDCVDQEKFIDRMVESLAEKGQARSDQRSENRIAPEEFGCASRIVIREFGPRAIGNLLTGSTGAAESAGFDEVAAALSLALRSCVDLDKFATTTTTVPPTPEPTSPDHDMEETMADIRSKMVDILIEREGLSREAAGTRADELMEQGVEKEIVDDQFAIYEDWMDNYQSHPMLGHRWTPDEANCVIIEMMRVNGIYETDRLVKGATAGGMTEHDALALVMPVAGCVDLGALVLEDMADAGLEQDPACLLAGVTGEQIAGWYVTEFTDGPDGFHKAFSEDLDWSCIPST